MHYTKEERLNIGQRIYNGEITRYQAAEEYGISDQTARDYMRLYRDANHLPPKHGTHKSSISGPNPPTSMEDLASMSKEQQYDLITQELVWERLQAFTQQVLSLPSL